MRKSKLQERAERLGTTAAKPISRGPFFRVISEEEPPMSHDWSIEAGGIYASGEPRNEPSDPPTEGEIRATAEQTVRKLDIAYRCKHHWERIKFEPVSKDGLTGAPAKLEAFRRVLDGPDTPGRRFLREHKKIFKDVPKTPKAKTTASAAMLDRLSEPIATGAGPIPFKPGENDIADD